MGMESGEGVPPPQIIVINSVECREWRLVRVDRTVHTLLYDPRCWANCSRS